MKKSLTLAAVTLLATSLSFAQSWTGVLKEKATNPSVKTTRVKTSTQKDGLGDKVSLNPQPLPPKTANGSAINSRASKVSLNPQPLPPKTATSGIRNSPGSKVSLNPQPLPPKVAHTTSRTKIKTNVQKSAPVGAKNSAAQR